MHPEFETIWRELTQMGFFITLQTNAAPVPKFERLFQECPPRACKITLYGSNDQVYRDVCQVEEGFTKADAGIQMLRRMKVPIELVSTVICQNLNDVDNIIRYVDKNRLQWYTNIKVRTAGRGVEVDMERLRIQPTKKDDLDKDERELVDPDRKPCTYCRDFRLGYWIVWSGYMRFCSFMNGPDIPVRDKSFKACWKELVEFQANLEWPVECKECKYQKSCVRCAALFDIHNGNLKIRDEFCKRRKG